MSWIDIYFYIKKYSYKLGIANEVRSLNQWVEDLFDENILLRNKSLEKIHENERCFIFGNGISVNDIDMSLLAEEYTFSSNFLNYHKDFRDLNVNYYSTIAPPRLLKNLHDRMTYTNSKINDHLSLLYTTNLDSRMSFYNMMRVIIQQLSHIQY